MVNIDGQLWQSTPTALVRHLPEDVDHPMNTLTLVPTDAGHGYWTTTSGNGAHADGATEGADADGSDDGYGQWD